ncbi:unnamed protein product [Arctia plantaginis]|uniref:ATP synthase subunit b n=1 Tax=Arctia plantaginis TaxID=874455 RepID=A0A8S0YSH7_ARCPL|nr:unnamed protein product [Arctia plantaginis]
MSDISWVLHYDGLQASLTNNIHHNNFISTLRECGLVQYNSHKNHVGGILDLVLCNDVVSVSTCPDPLVKEDPYHRSLIIRPVFFKPELLKSCPRNIFSYHRADYDSIRKELSDVDWLTVLGADRIDDAVNSFYGILYHLRNKYVPKVTKNFGRQIGEILDKEVKAVEDFMQKDRNEEIASHDAIIKEGELAQSRAKAQEILMEAKKENIVLQLEAEYRERLMMAYRAFRDRLQYHLKRSRTEKRFQQRWMIKWILKNVSKSVTPEFQREALSSAIRDLAALASQTKYSVALDELGIMPNMAINATCYMVAHGARNWGDADVINLKPPLRL